MTDEELLHAFIESLPEESAEGGEQMPVLHVQGRPDETVKQGMARAALTPEFRACLSITYLNKGGPFKGADPTELATLLERQTAELQYGDMSRADSILAGQATTLDALFHNLLQRGMLNAGQYFGAAKEYLRLALIAQSQCAGTIAKLAELKRPVIRQTNIAHGHQQINNCPGENPPNELKEKDRECLDARTQKAASAADSDLEAMGEEHGAEDLGGKAPISDELMEGRTQRGPKKGCANST